MPLTDSIGIKRNVLEKFASYNSIFTISALTSEQINFPESATSYKNNQLGQIILRSAAGKPDNRVMTAYTSAANPTGKYDFYIDNIEIGSLITYDKRTKGTNSTNISFEIFEPYSLGMFLQTLQLAAAAVSDQGMMVNYTEIPFLLTIEFIGYDSAGNIVPVDDVLNRHIPFTWGQIEMDITASGCRYKCTAIPYNESALSDEVNTLKSDIKISGITVQEILQSGTNSLQRWANERSKEMAKQGSETGKEEYVPDEIVIIFPKDGAQLSSTEIQDDAGQAATVNPASASKDKKVQEKLTLNKSSNSVGGTAGSVKMLVQNSESLNDIGKSKMGFDLDTGGDSQLKPKDQIQKDPDKPNSRKDNVYDPKDKVFKFGQGTTIVNAITEVLLMSEFCKTNAVAPSDKLGLKKWFRIETQVFNLKPQPGNNNRAKIPKLYVFKVVEYSVHEHRFKPPGSQPQGYSELRKNAVKEYNYIYTGKNVDIINFNIQLKAGLFTTAYADKNALAGSVYPQINGQGVGTAGQPTNDEANKSAVEKGVPVVPVGETFRRYKNAGGGPNDDYRSLVAKNFYEALLNSQADLMTAEIEILGDPYYIADSGMGNFSDIPANFNETQSGAMNYQSGEVDVIVNFRTPSDYNSITGTMDFMSGVENAGFSGLYNVQEVTNVFKGGKFTQTLKAIRRPVQEPVKEQPTETKQEVKKQEVPVAEQASAKPEPPKQQTFAQAFASARSSAGNSGGRFSWTDPKTGKTGVYHTGYKGENVLPANTDEGKSLTQRPGQTPKKSIDSVTKGSRESQVEYTNTGIPIPGRPRGGA